MTAFKRLMTFAAVAATVACLPALIVAKKPTEADGPPDLEALSITIKSNCKSSPCKINNVSLSVGNNGGNASNSRVEFYLSDDTVLTTATDEVTTVADTLLHSVSLGAVKAGKTKKRTLGGGHLKQASAASGQYVIALVDSDNVLSETLESNNIVVSEPLP